VHVHSGASAIAPATAVTLLYDASGSGVQRDAAKLRDFLTAFLAKQDPSTRVTIVPFHVSLEAAHESDVQRLGGRDRASSPRPRR
jgi:hypothetical protein